MENNLNKGSYFWTSLVKRTKTMKFIKVFSSSKTIYTYPCNKLKMNHRKNRLQRKISEFYSLSGPNRIFFGGNLRCYSKLSWKETLNFLTLLFVF
jgi:hypothetical protein